MVLTRRDFALVAGTGLAGLLHGCARAQEAPVEETPQADSDETGSDEPGQAEEPAGTEAEEEAPEEELTETASAADAKAPADIQIGLGGTGYGTYDPDTVVGTVNGTEVPWVEYYYWLSYYTSISQQLAQIFGMDISGWDSNELYTAYAMGAMYGYLSIDLTAYGITV